VALVRPSIRDELTVVELDGEAVIYDERSGNLHHLNPTATIVLALCDGTSTISQMSADLAVAFGQPSEAMERQVRALLRDFRKVDLLAPSNGRAAARAKEAVS
jgi:PqqD family protein of HPr-rel-A system